MNFLKNHLIALIFSGSVLGQADTSLLPQDYKCGISIRYSGAEGVDWIAEDMFHEPLQNNRRTVYIRDTTDITLFHNAMNTQAKGAGNSVRVVGAAGLDGIPGNADDGTIRYRVDGDMSVKALWAEDPAKPHQTNSLLPAYSGPFSFSDLTYEPYHAAVSVVGTVGNNGKPITDKLAYYHYGILDSAGDEWHSLQIGDDDFASYPTDKHNYWASDGKEQLFVINPKTPCVTVARTGNGQFYTTPAKAYFVPKIHNQTTYILPRTGTVSVTLTDIYGGVVEYRLNGGLWTTNGTNTVALPDSAFSTGSNKLECRYASTPSVIRTRTVVKNPPFPSAGESHGNLLWADANEFQKIKARLTRSPYNWFWNDLRTNRKNNLQNSWNAFGMQGHRRPWYGSTPSVGTKAGENAFLALVQGWDTPAYTGAPKTYAQYAKEMLLDNVLNLDPVGVELSAGNTPAPMTENRGGGYYVVNNTHSMAIGYDLLIAHYRSDQHANGITSIEDYFVRDMLASFAVIVFQSFTAPVLGMWTPARASGVFMSGIAMADYDTPYYGTSGYNGTTAATHRWTPFPDEAFTWKQVLTDILAATLSYPNRMATYDIDNPSHEMLGNSETQYGYWLGTNLGYWNLMQPTFWVTTNLSALHTTKEWPVVQQAYRYSVLGEMRGDLGAGTTLHYSQQLAAINDRHPNVVEVGRKALIDRGAPDIGSLLTLLWYDDGGNAMPSAPKNLRMK